jgi:hypothetical protein
VRRMTDSGKREESISELIDKLDDIREQLFHVQRSLEIIEAKSKENIQASGPKNLTTSTD